MYIFRKKKSGINFSKIMSKIYKKSKTKKFSEILRDNIKFWIKFQVNLAAI